VMEDDKEVDNSEEPKTTVDSRQNISVVTCFLLVGALLGLYYLVYTTDSQLPSPLDSSDEVSTIKYHPVPNNICFVSCSKLTLMLS
jgi:hypothetical protein